MRLIDKKTFWAIFIPLCFIMTFVMADISTDVEFNDAITPTATIGSTSLPVALTTTSSLDTYSFINLDSSLKGWWRFEGNLNDSSGYGNTGTNGTNYTTGKFGQTFNSSGDYVALGALTGEFSGSMSSFSISTWVYLDENIPEGVNKIIFGDSYSKLLLIGTNSKIHLGIYPSSGYYGLDSATALNLDTWYHVVATYDATSGGIVYIDGTSNSTMVGHGASRNSTNYTVGSGTGKLLIDDILIFNRVLTSDEVLSLYNSQTTEYNETFTVSTSTSHTIKGYAVDTDGDIASTSERTITYSSATVPTVTTSPASSVEKRTAVLNATVTSDGNASTTDRGFYYGTSVSYGSVASTTASGGIGTFSEAISGLTCNTTYHYMAFAINSAGTATSSDATFETDNCGARRTVTNTSSGSTSDVSTTSSISTESTSTASSTDNTSGQTETETPDSGPSDTDNTQGTPNQERFVFRNNLQFRTNNFDVLELQIFLNNSGFILADSGAGSPGNETTYFGTLTFKALQKFQASAGIIPSGYFGPITRAYINGL